MESLRNMLLKLYAANRRVFKLIAAICAFYVAMKMYRKYQYAQKLYSTPSETSSKAILITGCDTGFGNMTALQLSITHNYRVIATCLKQESVDKFLSNSAFVANKSTATVLDVSSAENIESVRQFTIKYLKQTNSTLWGLVNNAGFAIPGPFELVPAELDALQRNVLFDAPVRIIRAFLPLFDGRKNYKTKQTRVNDGGRIVNIASVASHCISDTRYGVSKAALGYFSHALRMELSPLFGIWVSVVEPGPFGTTIWNVANVWAQKILKKLKETGKEELIEVYKFDVPERAEVLSTIQTMLQAEGPDVQLVVDAVIHGLIGKHPQRVYRPGWILAARWSYTTVYSPWALHEHLMMDNPLR